jgi:hypothetical protein
MDHDDIDGDLPVLVILSGKIVIPQVRATRGVDGGRRALRSLLRGAGR